MVIGTRASRKYGAIMRTQVANSLVYPLDLVGRALSILIFLWVFVHLWRTAFASAGVEIIAGLSYSDTLWYLVITETIMLSKLRMSEEIAERVRDGSVAYILNKPYSFVLYHFAVGLGDSLVRGLITALVGGALVFAIVGPPPSLLGVAIVPFAIIAAWLLDYCMSGLIGLAAFVTEDVTAFDWIYSKMILILGGTLIPLEFFPDWLRGAAKAMPFAWTMWAPARLFLDPSPERIASVAFGQLAWLAVMGGVLAAVYRVGARRLAINGG